MPSGKEYENEKSSQQNKKALEIISGVKCCITSALYGYACKQAGVMVLTTLVVMG